MRVPRALWTHAPLALFHHRAVLVAVVCTSFLVAGAAAADPLLRAGAESEALKGKLDVLSPLSAALTIETPSHADRDVAEADEARRSAARRLARTLPWTEQPILTATSTAEVVTAGNLLDVVPMARTDATAHVQRLAGSGDGAWIAQRVAQLAAVRPGESLRLQTFGGPRVAVRVAAVYLQLDEDLANSYWVNFTARIRSANPDASPPPTFVLVSPSELYRLARQAGGGEVGDTFELPVDERAMSPGRARAVVREFAGVRRRLRTDRAFARSLGCVPACSVTSSLDAAVRLADESVAALTPVIRLLTGFAVLIALGAAFVAGAFGVRRRSGEAHLSVAGGETRAAFALRAALEALAPVVVGAAAGLGGAAFAARALAPDGTLDRHVAVRAALVAVAAAACALAAVAAGSGMARGAGVERSGPRSGARRLAVWEVPALAAAAVLFVVVDRGGGLVRNGDAGAHPRLVTLCVPLLLAAGLGGLAVRAWRRPLRAGRSHPTTVFLAQRRLAAAPALVVLLVVTAAVAFAALTFAVVLRHSLAANSEEKAYVANGADVQGVVDASARVRTTPAFPVTKVVELFNAATLDGARPVEVLAVDPPGLRRVLRWRWAGNPGTALARLAASRARLPAIAVGVGGADSVAIAGRRERIDVVASLPAFPGMLATEPLLVVPLARLRAVAPRALDGATAYVWARGDGRAFARLPVAPTYVTTVDDFLDAADLTTASRSYGYLRLIAFGAAIVAFLALLLYLHARARSQLVTSELLARMGLTRGRQAASVALESAAVVALAAIVGGGSGLVSARALVHAIDPLPQYAPAASPVFPWAALVLGLLAATAAAAAAGAAAVLLARGDLAEAVRVA
jgi:hypothetical protein